MAVTTRTLPRTFTVSHSHLTSLPCTHRHRRVSFLPLYREVSLVMRVGGEKGDSSYSSERPQPSFSSEQVPLDKENELKGEQGKDPLKVYGSARIHDFCFGIPYGAFLCAGGLLSFLDSSIPKSKSLFATLFGATLLALGTLSLKVWRRGVSSLPLVLGQAVMSGYHFWICFRAYSRTKKLIPAGIHALIGGGMLCFYCYVMISGGNPPPKKSRASA